MGREKEEYARSPLREAFVRLQERCGDLAEGRFLALRCETLKGK